VSVPQDPQPTAWLSAASLWEPDFLKWSAWLEHTPFAFWVMDAIKPSRFVELGTHQGQSFMAFCQAADRLNLDCSTFAVDTWRGDEHAGFYGQEILDELRALHDPRYGRFSQLLQMTFKEAADVIEDGTVDLLHIDGRHFEDDVREDFLLWLPKLSESGVVLFHDTQVRERGFGVYRVWAELAEQYPSFEFHHGHGLGVLAVGPNVPEPVGALIAAGQDSATAELVRSTYAKIGGGYAWQLGMADTRVQLIEAVGTRDALEAERDALLADRSQLIDLLDERARSIKSLTKRVAAEQKKLKELRASTSWKLTKPVRSLGGRARGKQRSGS
jgi:hypothetical protein